MDQVQVIFWRSQDSEMLRCCVVHMLGIVLNGNLNMYLGQLDRRRLEKLQWQILQNVAASVLICLMRMGDELGLLIVLADGGSYSVEAFAKAANIDAR